MGIHHHVTAIVACTLFAGCADTAGNGSPSDSHAVLGQSAELKSALDDGQVTFAEYEAGFLRYKDCLALAGYEVAGVQFDSSTQLYSALIPNSAIATGQDESCYNAEYGPLDMSWQANLDRPGNTDVTLGNWYRECLVAAGVTVAEGLTPRQLLEALNLNGVDPAKCVSDHLATRG